MKQNKNILRAALLLLLVIAAPGARAQKLITANADGTYTITMPDHNVKVTADVKKLLTHQDISVSIPSQEWTGSELAPVITVTDDKTTLTPTTDYTVTAPSGTIQDASDYTFTINGAGNYSGETTATFTITPKPVTVKANDMTKVIGEADPTLTATVTGLVDGYDITYDLSRETGEEAGTYIITPSGATAQGNYTVTYLTGTMTIAMPTQVSIALTEEYGTYCSDYDLDFSGATGLTAYIAAGYNKTEHTLLMVKVTSVPKGTGLLLKGTKGSTYTAKVQTSPYVYSNLLTGTIRLASTMLKRVRWRQVRLIWIILNWVHLHLVHPC